MYYILKNLIITILFIVIIASFGVISHIENQRYAMITGLCNPTVPRAIPCLTEVETRTSAFWHILFATLDTVSELSEKYSSDVGSWDGYIYVDKLDLQNFFEIGKFSTLEDCRKAALDRLHSSGRSVSGDYECALNCVADGPGPKLCEKTKH